MVDGEHFHGWSLCLGGLGNENASPYFFDTATPGTTRNSELPNMGLYFQALLEESLVTREANPELLDQVFAYVLPHIRDDGPPPCAQE